MPLVWWQRWQAFESAKLARLAREKAGASDSLATDLTPAERRELIDQMQDDDA